MCRDGRTYTRSGWGGPDSVPTAVGGGITFAQLAAGGTNHQCGITSAGIAYCWGDNRQGQLGDGGTTNSATPIAVAGGLIFASISTGGAHSCGVAAAGSAYRWGFNNSGQLGECFALAHASEGSHLCGDRCGLA